IHRVYRLCENEHESCTAKPTGESSGMDRKFTTYSSQRVASRPCSTSGTSYDIWNDISIVHGEHWRNGLRHLIYTGGRWYCDQCQQWGTNNICGCGYIFSVT